MTHSEKLFNALDSFAIETPSWGFADTGTRFGKFQQAAAATTIEEKLADAGAVHRFTGICPTVAVHVLWDFAKGMRSVPETMALAAKYGVKIGAINPNVFQDQIYKYGSLGSPDAEARKAALAHILESVEIATATGSRDLSLWFADGTNYPGTGNIRQRQAVVHRGTARGPPQPAQRTSACWWSTSRSSPPSTTPTSPTGA